MRDLTAFFLASVLLAFGGFTATLAAAEGEQGGHDEPAAICPPSYGELCLGICLFSAAAGTGAFLAFLAAAFAFFTTLAPFLATAFMAAFIVHRRKRQQ